MSFNVVAHLDPLRSLAFGGISGAYALVGTAFANPVRLICFTNNTDGDMIFTDDTTVAAGKLFIAAFSFKLFDVTSNRATASNIYTFPIGMQWYVKQSTVASKNAVYVEVIY